MTATSVDERSSNGQPPTHHHRYGDGDEDEQQQQSSATTTTTTTDSIDRELAPSGIAGPVELQGEPNLPDVRLCTIEHRMLSESDADIVRLTKQRKQRRRRGKGRWKPYHNMTTEEKLAKDERVERNALRKRARLFSNGKPMAPYNTTQFLLEDREKRVTVDSDGDSVSGTAAMPKASISPQRERERLLSGSDAGGNTSESGSVSGEEDELMEREFEAEYDNVNLMRINGMSREEVSICDHFIIREMMYLERNNGKLMDQVSLLNSENENLKKLLTEHKIEYADVLSAKRSRSGDSFDSDVSAVLVPESSPITVKRSDMNTRSI
ncbi:unnamed protein product [Anisakis simplex]|uniref:Hexamethylene bis-acetamide inducible 1 n=1 Tax=Anisakis simplex TaxID=6269 RepID=A0A0M3K8H1_ANISI|nr:unnamed protein product [Anisakis simplex]